VLAIRHVHIADDVNNSAVGLLRQALVLTSVTSLHVEDGDMQTLCANHAQAAIGITKNQYCIRLYLHHQLVALGNDVTHGLTQVITYGFHIHIRISQLQILEEHPVQVIVIVLTCMCQQRIKILTTFINHSCQSDNLRACTHDNQQLQFSIIFKLSHNSIR